MGGDPQRQRYYAVVGRGEGLDPNYERVARSLSDADLEDEILAGRGEPGYKLALLAEAERRGQAPPAHPDNAKKEDW